MNALRVKINNILDEEEVDGCVVHTDILHKKIQSIAVDLLNEDAAIEAVAMSKGEEDVEHLRNYITYCPYDYEDESYATEYEPPEHIKMLGKGLIEKAIAKFLEDIS